MLQNLHDVAVNARQRYRDEFTASEIVLSEAFKDAYGASLRRDGQDVDFTAHTAIVTTSGNLKMYIPNQWFCAAAYTVAFIQLHQQYKQITDAIISDCQQTATARKEYTKQLKETDDTNVIDEFRAHVRNYLQTRIPADELNETVELITQFATNYEWWYGSKTIDRGDSYVSPVLSLLGVVNASQGYIAEISYKFATERTLTEAALEMIDNATNEAEPVENTTFNPEDAMNLPRLTGGVNEIVYGAPGTGKSKYLSDAYGRTTDATRVVFHPEYTIFDFVGTYKPVPIYKTSDAELHTLGGDAVTTGEPIIDYRFVPGPFVQVLIKAWLNPNRMHTLIIEEINRANTAAVFGEVFQLLDRDINGESEYSIYPSYDLAQYLNSIPGMAHFVEDGLKIPSNMNIVATMNSADQGVMPMDSAFKRRWSFKYVRIAIEGAVHENARLAYAGMEVTWGNLVRAINSKLMGLGLEEDRLIGPYFIKPEEIGSRRATDKLLLYLWDDVLRHNRDVFFNNQVNTFSDLSDQFSASDVFDLLNGTQAQVLIPENAETTVEETEEETEEEAEEEAE